VEKSIVITVNSQTTNSKATLSDATRQTDGYSSQAIMYKRLTWIVVQYKFTYQILDNKLF